MQSNRPSNSSALLRAALKKSSVISDVTETNRSSIERLPKDIWREIFHLLPVTDLLNMRLVCEQLNVMIKDYISHHPVFDKKQIKSLDSVIAEKRKKHTLSALKNINFRTQILLTHFNKNNSALMEAVLSGNVNGVLASLRNGANVNMTTSFKPKSASTHLDLDNCNLLHVLIYKMGGSWKGLFDIGTKPYVEIFKILLQHGIDIHHKNEYETYSDFLSLAQFGVNDVNDYIHNHQETPLASLKGDFDNKRFRALLILRQAEITFEKTTNLKNLINEIKTASQYSKTITSEYLVTVFKENKGFRLQYKPETVSELMGNTAIQACLNAYDMQALNPRLSKSRV